MLHIPFDCVDVHLGVRLQIITFHMSLLYAHLIPGGFLTDGLFCPGQRTCFFHTALCVYARREHERPNVCHGGCHAALHSEPWALSADCLIREGGVRRVWWGGAGVAYHWSQLVTMKTSTLTAAAGTWMYASVWSWFWENASCSFFFFFFCDVIHPLENMKGSSLHCLTWHEFDIQVKAGQ